MPQLQIKNHRTEEIIYHGQFNSAKDCVEQAAQDNVCLDYADLRHANLSHVSLDDAIMRHARLDHANLTGANLSEARLSGTSFAGVTLHGACLAFSALDGCNFENCEFGGTYIAGAVLDNARFSALSAFSLNFIDAERMDDCIYTAASGVSCPFSRPPLAINGLALPVVFLDRHLKIGRSVRTYEEWRSFTNDNVPASRPDSGRLYTFFRQHQNLFAELCRSELSGRVNAGYAETA